MQSDSDQGGPVPEEATEREQVFKARLSHGLCSPMNAVVGLAGLILASDPLTTEQREYARALKLSADSVLSQLDDMFDMTRSDALAKPVKKTRLPDAAAMPPADIPVLLVEDYEPNILLATTFLRGFGYRVDVACNGLLAVERAIGNSYLFAMMDLQIPGIDGLEATRRIRAHEAAAGDSRLPIVGVTAHSLSGDRDACLAAGMDAYLAKPFTAADLHEQVASVLS
ncbi:MAG: response regulator [Asticcacaulis sp.]